jgi:alkylhydroperoxidase family enzyme
MQQESSEELYCNVENYNVDNRYSEREKLAIEYAERFALNHLSLDDEFFKRLKKYYSDKEIFDLTICVATFLGFGRLTYVLGLSVSKPLLF